MLPLNIPQVLLKNRQASVGLKNVEKSSGKKNWKAANVHKLLSAVIDLEKIQT